MFQKCQETISIDGLLLSGLNKDGIDLLQSYVDATGDIQTVAIISALSGSSDRADRFNMWIQVYRNLLDSWKLWHIRAKFDAKCTIILHSYKTKQDKYLYFYIYLLYLESQIKLLKFMLDVKYNSLIF